VASLLSYLLLSLSLPQSPSSCIFGIMLRGNRQKDLLQPWLRARIVLNTEGRLVLLEGLEDLREAVAVRWDSELDDLPMVVGYLRAREEAHDLEIGRAHV
jgi:hypothetical protein